MFCVECSSSFPCCWCCMLYSSSCSISTPWRGVPPFGAFCPFKLIEACAGSLLGLLFKKNKQNQPKIAANDCSSCVPAAVDSLNKIFFFFHISCNVALLSTIPRLPHGSLRWLGRRIRGESVGDVFNVWRTNSF